tara:strand:+ start:1703 stop:2131 length:429 start_codon:yes stop_codon:yes gene_type:complete
MENICFECGKKRLCHKHHILPKCKGGKKTVLLCEKCHTKVHNKNMSTSYLVRLSLIKKEPEILCRIFWLIVGKGYDLEQIADDLEFKVKHPIKKVKRQIKRMLQIDTEDLITCFADILNYDNCVYYTKEHFINCWNFYKKTL